MKPYLITTVAAFLTLFLGVSAQGVLLNEYTTLDVPGASTTYATGIDGGNIVGRYRDGSGTHGFSYDGTTYTTLDVPGATDTFLFGIDGSNIVGYYYDDVGRPRGFLATIPEPTTLSLLAVGLLMACRRRR